MTSAFSRMLLIDCGAHEQIIHRFLKIIDPNDIDLLVLRSRQSWLSDVITPKYKIFKYIKIIFWVQILIRSVKANKIIFYTPPEYTKGLVGILDRFFLFLHLMFYSHKTLIFVRNINKWKDQGENKILPLSFIIGFSDPVFVYEDLTLLQNASLGSRQAIFPVSYYRNIPMKFGNRLNICFTGRNDLLIRDYELLWSALDMLQTLQKFFLSFHFASPVNPKIKRYLSNRIGKEITTLFSENHSDYDTIMSESNLLICPLRHERGYGSEKGTGAVGDALYFNRLLIVPEYASSSDTYSKITLSYSDEFSLYAILSKAIDCYIKKEFNFFALPHEVKNIYSKRNLRKLLNQL
jgi:hypothetical protein